MEVKRVSKTGQLKETFTFYPPENFDNCEHTIKLSNFIEKWKDLPVQGTPEWFENRRYKIGGSEFAAYINRDPYKTRRDMLNNKINPVMIENRYTRWGNLFENSVREFTEKLFSTRIYETGSIPYLEYDDINQESSEKYGFQYSPDGIGVVNDGSNKIALFEFKCPASRILDNKIPSYYIPQVKMGLSVLNDLVDFGIFCEFTIKVCNEEQYNTHGHLSNYESMVSLYSNKVNIRYLNGFNGIKKIDKIDNEKEFFNYSKSNYCIDNENYDLTIYYKIINYNCFYIKKHPNWIKDKTSAITI